MPTSARRAARRAKKDRPTLHRLDPTRVGRPRKLETDSIVPQLAPRSTRTGHTTNEDRASCGTRNQCRPATRPVGSRTYNLRIWKNATSDAFSQHARRAPPRRSRDSPAPRLAPRNHRCPPSVRSPGGISPPRCFRSMRRRSGAPPPIARLVRSSEVRQGLQRYRRLESCQRCPLGHKPPRTEPADHPGSFTYLPPRMHLRRIPGLSDRPVPVSQASPVVAVERMHLAAGGLPAPSHGR